MINTKITQKMAKVILSCKTFDQIDSALVYLKLAVKAHGRREEQEAILKHGLKLVRWKKKILKKRAKMA